MSTNSLVDTFADGIRGMAKNEVEIRPNTDSDAGLAGSIAQPAIRGAA